MYIKSELCIVCTTEKSLTKMKMKNKTYKNIHCKLICLTYRKSKLEYKTQCTKAHFLVCYIQPCCLVLFRICLKLTLLIKEQYHILWSNIPLNISICVIHGVGQPHHTLIFTWTLHQTLDFVPKYCVAGCWSDWDIMWQEIF